jgi:hypothetical protein
MDSQYDFTRLECNLYLHLLEIFRSTTGIAIHQPDDEAPAWFDEAAHVAETLAIEWLKVNTARKLDFLLEHVWPNVCQLAELTGEDAENYDEADEYIHEVLGLTDEFDTEPEAWMILTGMVSCAKALAASDPHDSYLYAFHARGCAGMVVGALWARELGAGTGREFERERLAQAGRISGIVRREKAKASPDAVLELERRLLRDGKSFRETASIIAARLGVTPEYVRQLRRRMKK